MDGIHPQLARKANANSPLLRRLASPRSPAPPLVFRAAGILLLAGVAAWAVVMSAAMLGQLTLPGSSRTQDALKLAPPLLLGLVCVARSRPAGPSLRLASGASAVTGALLLLVPDMLSSPSLAYEIPALAVLSWAVLRWPAAGLLIVLAITGSFGSLAAYLSFPYNKTLYALLAALGVAAIARLIASRRQNQLELPLGVVAVAAYLAVSAGMVMLAADRSLAINGFELAPVSLLGMLIVAYSQWPLATHQRIVTGLNVIALGVGAYATLRYFIGPSASERALAIRNDAAAFFSIFNFNGGKLKLLGSFPNGADLAAWTSLMIPFCAACALGCRRRTRAIAAAALPLLAIGVFGAGARLPVIAALLATLLVIGLYLANSGFSGVRIGYGLVAVGAIVVIGVGAYEIAGSSKSNQSHSLLSLLSGPSHDASFNQHQYKWNQAFHDLHGHPFGYGLGSSPTGYGGQTPAVPQYFLQTTGLSVDNGYLKVALEQGLVVMCVFGAALIMLASGLARRAVRLRDPARATIVLGAAGVLSSLLMLEMGGAYADSIPTRGALLLVGLGVSEAIQRRSAEDESGA